MNAIEKSYLYELSERLSVEIAILGVGEEMFLPAQQSAPAFTQTREGATAEWMMAAIDRQSEPLSWIHTHPRMGAFFSNTDVQGAHNYFEMVQRPITATVLGEKGAEHVEEITAEWIAAHPKMLQLSPMHEWEYPENDYSYRQGDLGFGRGRGSRLWKPEPGMGEEFWQWYSTNQQTVPVGFWSWGHKRRMKWWRKCLKGEGTRREPTLRSDLEWIVEEYGQHKLLEALEEMGVITLIHSLKLGE